MVLSIILSVHCYLTLGGFVDYISIPIMSNLASKDSSINITLAIINDDVVELSQENFTVTLLPDTSVEGIIISRNTTNIIIQDDDCVFSISCILYHNFYICSCGSLFQFK